MPAYDPERLRTFLARIDDGAATAQDKGKSLEDLTEHLFALIPGVQVMARDTHNQFHSEEIDLAVWNEARHDGLSQLPAEFLIECKNWQSPVGAAGVCWFLVKLERRSLTFGILVAAHGISGGSDPEAKAARDVAAYFLSKGIRLVVLTRSDLGTLTTTEQLVTLIRRKLARLLAGLSLHEG